MNKRLPLVALALSATALFAAPPAPRMSQNHVPATLAEIRPFVPAAANRPHILLVNVGGAMAPENWSLSSTYAVSRLQLNVWTNAIDTVAQERLLADPSLTEKLFMNPNAKVGVYFVNRKGGAPVVAAPGYWAVVNVAAAHEGSPDPQLLRDRLAKFVLKGIAAASGGGHTVEPFCSMFYGTRDIKGMDKGNIMLSPMCYFPMLEVLRRAGGDEMTIPEQ